MNEALDQQRTATGIVSSVTAEQISRSPDSDAAQAVQRVSGVTVQDSRYVFGSRTRRAIHDGVARTESHSESRAGKARRPARPVPLRPAADDHHVEDVHAGPVRTTSAARRSTSGRASFPARSPDHVQRSTTGVTTRTQPDRTFVAPHARAESAFALVEQQAQPRPRCVASLGNFQGYNSLNQGDKNTAHQHVPQFLDAAERSSAPAERFRRRSPSAATIAVAGHRIGYLRPGPYSVTEDQKSDQIRAALADRGPTPGSTVEIDRFDGVDRELVRAVGRTARTSARCSARTRASC